MSSARRGGRNKPGGSVFDRATRPTTPNPFGVTGASASTNSNPFAATTANTTQNAVQRNPFSLVGNSESQNTKRSSHLASTRGAAAKVNGTVQFRGQSTRARGSAPGRMPSNPLASRGRGRDGKNGVSTNRGGSKTSATVSKVLSAQSFDKMEQKNMSPEERWRMLKRKHEQDQATAIAQGLMADPNVPRLLSEAIALVGTCPDMCPEFERGTRIFQGDVHPLEQSADGTPDEPHMVKRFRRSAAGNEEQIPSDLRPPKILQKSLDYLIDEIIGVYHEPLALRLVHEFVWDRTRAIRNDFSIQGVQDLSNLRIAIDCFERIVRFHIITMHQIGGRPKPEREELDSLDYGRRMPDDRYDYAQDLEQGMKALVSLFAYYDQARRKGFSPPNEPEFRAYWIITRIPEGPSREVESKVQRWSIELQRHPRIVKALEIYTSACNAIDPRTREQVIAPQNFDRFWNVIGSTQTSYLMACAAEIFFDLIRKTALFTAAYGYARGNRDVSEWTLENLQKVLRLDTFDEVQGFAESHGFAFKEQADGELYLDITTARRMRYGQIAASRSPRIQYFSEELVEWKRFGRTFPAIINGLNFEQAEANGQIEEILHEEEMADVGENDEGAAIGQDDDDEEDDDEDEEDDAEDLFVPQTDSSTDSDEFQETKNLKTPSGTLNPFASPFSPVPGTQETSKPFKNPFPLQIQDDDKSSDSSDSEVKSSIFTSTTKPSHSLDAVEDGFSKPKSKFPVPSIFSSSAAPKIDLGSSIFTKPSTPSVQQAVTGRSTQSDQPSLLKSSTSFFPDTSPTTGSEKTQASGSGFTPFAPTSSVFNFNGASKPTGQFSFEKPTSSPLISPPTTQTADVPKSNFELARPSTTQPWQALTPSTQKSLPSFEPFDKSKAEEPPAFKSSPTSSALAPNTNIPAFNFSKAEGAGKEKSVTFGDLSAPKSSFSGFNASQPNTTFQKPSFTTSPSSAAPNVNFNSSPKEALKVQGHGTAPSLVKPPLSSVLPESSKPHMPAVKDMSATGSSRRDERRAECFDYLARQLLLDPKDGMLYQYIAFSMEPMFKEIKSQVDLQKALEEANQLRRTTLARKYGAFWRNITMMNRKRKQATERRQRIAAASMRRSHQLQEAAVKRQQIQMQYPKEAAQFEEIASNAERILRERKAARKIEVEGAANEPSLAQNGNLTAESPFTSRRPPMRRHRRTQTATSTTTTNTASSLQMGSINREPTASNNTNPLRNSAGPTFLSGDPLRTSENDHLFKGKLSTFSSNYFQLKARGLTHLSDAFIERTNRKRQRVSSGGDPVLAELTRFTSSLSASPEYEASRKPLDRPSASRESEIYGVTGSKRKLYHSDRGQASSSITQKRKNLDEESKEDEELFARVRKVRDAMDESIHWYQTEIEQLRLSGSPRSTPGLGQTLGDNKKSVGASPLGYSQISFASPIAQGQQSTTSYPKGSPEPTREDLMSYARKKLPAYWFRESKFIPRSEYGVAPQAKRTKIDSPTVDKGKRFAAVEASKTFDKTPSSSAVRSSDAVSAIPQLSNGYGSSQEPIQLDDDSDDVGVASEEGYDVANYDDETYEEEDVEEDDEDAEGEEGYEDDGDYDEEGYYEEFDDNDDDEAGGHGPPAHLQGGNSIDDAIEL